MKQLAKTILIVSLFFYQGQNLNAQETTFPEGYNVSSTYSLSTDDFSTDDTLLVTWSVANNEVFELNNLYLSETLPSEFIILASSLKINDLPAAFFSSGPVYSQVIPAYNVYRWTIDLPAADDSLNRSLMPGETLTLEYRAVCTTVGEYYFPFHTLACHGGSTGIFTTADTLNINVSPGSAIDEERDNRSQRTLITSAYPNPFNGEVIIKFDSNIATEDNIKLTIYDLTGGIIYENQYPRISGNGTIHWRPENSVASGIFFYKLISGSHGSAGKMVFIK